MKIFLHTASLDAIQRAADAGLLDGVSLSPLDLAQDDPAADIRERIAAIVYAFAVPVAVPVEAVAEADMYREGRELARVSDQVIVQVPFVEDAVPVIRRLVADGAHVGVTQVYSGAQAFLAAKAGAAQVMVDVADLEAHGLTGAQGVHGIRAVLDTSGLECDLGVTSVVNALQFTDYLLARADIVCIAPSGLGGLMVHSLTDRGVDRYLSALSRRHKPRSA